ncbi:MAG: recombinase family protein [Bacteroidales bacterium]|nr:recombinase family protein [Bacteroidales bacterium]
MKTKLRFAPIVRVSTEQQKKKGESLLTQKTQIKQYVASLSGMIPDTCWQYTGQEHATPEYERARLDQLLEDSDRGLFDAVIVCDASRWSRDNLKSKEGLKTLRGNGIRFFVGTMEYDLSNHTHMFYLGMATEINEWQAKEQAQKSIDSRVHRIRRGIPAIGERPYARTFNRKTEKWELDEEKAQRIRQIAEQYLSGSSLYYLAKSLQMTHTNLVNILTKRSGDTWTITFKGKEPVTFKIDRILPEETIQRVKDRLEFNRTNNRTDIKNKYVLSGFIRCEACGGTLTGQTQRTGKKQVEHKYYQHQSITHSKCKVFSSIACEPVERAVFLTIFENIVDVPSFERAIAESLPDEKMISDLEQKIKSSEKQLKQVQRELDKLVDLALSGTLTKETIKNKEQSLIEAKAKLEEKLQTDRDQLQSLPDVGIMRKEAETIRRKLLEHFSGKDRLREMTFDEKRKLLHWLFDGKDTKGTPYGVYITKTGKRKETKIDYFLYGRIKGLRTLKGDDINYQENEKNYKTNQVVNH